MTAPQKVIGVSIEGTNQARANLRVLMERIPETVRQATLENMQDVMIESQEECPYDWNNPHADGTPHLRDTAKSGFDDSGGEDTIIVYGSYSTPYAVYQHEIMEYNHLYPTKAKFLEDPANRHASRWVSDLLIKCQGVLENQTFIKLSPDAEIARDYNRWAGSHYAALSNIPARGIGHLGGRFV